MGQFPEVGYTPENLRYLISILGITPNQAAEYLGVMPRSLRMWLAETDKSSHRDMPLVQWRKLLNYSKS